MINFTEISVRRINNIGIAYGSWFTADNLGADGQDEIACQLIEDDQDSGEIMVGAQRLRWKK